MQITKEIINSSEIRLNLTISKLKTIVLVCLISSTSLLVRQTLQIQHSCNPMIHWSGDLPAECKVAVKTDRDSFDNFSSPEKQELKTPKQQPNIAQNTFKSQPDKVIYGPPTPTLENLQHNTETESKNTLIEIAKEHPVETIIGTASLVVGGVLAVAGLPLIGIPVAMLGVGAALFSIFH